MNLITWTAMLAQSPAGAQTENPIAMNIKFFGGMALLAVMLYFMAFRPQQQRTKQLNELLKTLKPGDKVITNSGIIGTVVSVKDKSIALRSAETKLEILKSSVSDVTERSGGEAGESKALSS